MQIYLLRHGTAEKAGPGVPDSARALTPGGRQDVLNVVERAQAAGLAPALIESSPLWRAVETAKLAAGVLGYTEPVPANEALLPSEDPHRLWDTIREHRALDQVLLAGHEPTLGQTAVYLLGCPEFALDVKPGAMLRIDVNGFGPQPRGILKWLLTPDLAGRAPDRL